MSFLLQFFANPLFLVGLGAAAVPLVLHLMHRRKAIEIPFPSLRFLRLSQNRTAKRKRLEELLLLIVRMLALACLALALAGPHLGSAGIGHASEPRAVAIVLDTGYSMSLTEGPTGRKRSRLEVAQHIATNTLTDLVNDQSQACLIPSSVQFEAAPAAGAPDSAATWANVQALSGRIDRVRDFVWQAQAAGAPSDLKAAVAAALKQLEASPLQHKELYILSDLRQAAWEPILSVLSKHPRSDIQAAVFDVRAPQESDRDDRSNLALEDLTLTSRQKLIGSPVVVSGRLHNYSDHEIRVRVAWDWGHMPQPGAGGSTASSGGARGGTGGTGTAGTGKQPSDGAPGTGGPGSGGAAPSANQPALWLQENHAEKDLTVPAHSTADVSFETTFRDQGSYVGRMSAGSDALAVDNARYAVYRVSDQIPVAIVPNPREHIFYQSSAFYLQSALDPFGHADPKGRRSSFSVHLYDSAELQKLDLTPYAAVILAGVDSLPTDIVKRIQAYVENGGGLIVFPAEGTDTDRLTQILGVRQETDLGPTGGLLPGRFGDRFGDPTNESGGETVRIDDHDHPAMAAFRGRFADMLNAVVVRAGRDIRVADNSSARTLLSTASGRPIMVSIRVGRGEVMQWGTSCDGRWGNLAITNFFPVSMHDMVLAMSNANSGGVAQSLGQMSARGSDLASGAVTVYAPDGRPVQCTHSAAQPAAWTAVMPGFYELVGGDGRRDVYAGNLDATQSDLQAVKPQSVAAALAWLNDGHGAVMGTAASEGPGSSAEVLHALRSGYAATRDFLFLAIALFLIELLLAERFFKPGAGEAAAGTAAAAPGAA
ncbi:MAG: BatA domain-containing protein [Planctomycetota bacterium]